MNALPQNNGESMEEASMSTWLKQTIQRQSKLEGKIRLSFQLVLLSVAVVMVCILIIGTVMFGTLVNAGYENLLREKVIKNAMDKVEHMVKEMATSIEAIVPQGTVIGSGMDPEARERVKELIRERTYDGPNGYYFMFDQEGRVIAQRIQREREGTNRFEAVDTDGQFYVQKLIEAAKQGGGFVEYKMVKPNQEGSYPKLSYAKMLSGNEWWVGSGFYLDDIEMNIQAMKKEVWVKILIITGLIIVFVCGLLLVALRLSRMLTQQITKPIAQLVDGANKLSTGEYGYRVAVDTQDELKLLADGFNTMGQKIEQKVTAMTALKNTASDTRKLLAGELHGAVGTFVQDMQTWLDFASTSEKDMLSKHLENCSRCLDRFRRSCEKIEFNMYPLEVDDFGVAISFKYFVEEKIERLKELRVDLDIDRAMPRSDKARQVALYLVAQSFVLNVLEYAKASHASISLRCIDGIAILAVDDNGIGFEAGAVLSKRPNEPSQLERRPNVTSHYGLRWVKAQVDVYQGHFDLDSSPGGGGTRVRVTIPWPEVADAQDAFQKEAHSW